MGVGVQGHDDRGLWSYPFEPVSNGTIESKGSIVRDLGSPTLQKIRVFPLRRGSRLEVVGGGFFIYF